MAMNDMNPEDARALLASTQQLRTHWSGVITSSIGIALTVNVAILSFFLKSYVDFAQNEPKQASDYLLIGSSACCLLLGLWRLYARYIDDHTANLYPDFLLYEGILNVPPRHSTSRYLSKEVPNVGLILESNLLSRDDKVKAIDELVQMKRIGDRGHLQFDAFVIGAMFFLTLLGAASALHQSQSFEWTYLSLIGNVLGLAFMGRAIGTFQCDPTKSTVEEVLGRYERSPSTA